jgi:hypothetical protein
MWVDLRVRESLTVETINASSPICIAAQEGEVRLFVVNSWNYSGRLAGEG